MSLLAEIRTIGISDPLGDQVAISVSYSDDAVADPKTGEPTIVASKTFLFAAGAGKDALYEQVFSYGKTILAARNEAALFAQQFPAGTKITVG